MAKKRQAEGLDIPAETRDIEPLPPGLELPAHPAAEFFPMLEGQEADDFNADIRLHGVNQAVTLIDVGDVRQVLDGRNRRRAAALAGQACPAELYVGSDPVRFVMQRNLRRRHLTDSQKAFAAAEAEGFTHGGRRVNDDGNADVIEGRRPVAITREEAAAMTGASVRNVARAAKIKKKGTPDLVDAVRQGRISVAAAVQTLDLPEADQKRVIEEVGAGRAKTAKQVLKRGRVKQRNAALKAKVVAEPVRKYAVILTDDEWSHETWSEQGQDRAAVMHYTTSADEVIKSRILPAADNAVNYMWSTVPHAPLAYEVMAARGFTYRSQFIWWKIYPGNKPGLGYWGRIEHEVLLIGTRGDVPCPAPGDNWRSVQLSFVGEHSRKPEWSYRMIEAYHVGLVGTMIEFNARTRRRGWSAWGNEIGLVEPPIDELEREFRAAPLLPDPDYIHIDRGLFTRFFGSAEDRAKIAAGRAEIKRLTAAKLTSSPAVALQAVAELPAEEPPENPMLRVLWQIEKGDVGAHGGGVAAADLARAIAEGYATPGRVNRKKGGSRPAMLSAHGAAELKAWRQRIADERAFDDASPAKGLADQVAFFSAEADSRGIPAPPLAGQVVDFVPPAFLLAESAERQEAIKKRDAKKGG